MCDPNHGALNNVSLLACLADRCRDGGCNGCVYTMSVAVCSVAHRPNATAVLFEVLRVLIAFGSANLCPAHRETWRFAQAAKRGGSYAVGHVPVELGSAR